MRVSEVPDSVILDYCGINEAEASDVVNVLKSAAKSFIQGYTGLTAAQVDEHEDLTDAYLILINDMYSQRDYTLSWQKQINPAAAAILHLYAVNYL